MMRPKQLMMILMLPFCATVIYLYWSTNSQPSVDKTQNNIITSKHLQGSISESTGETNNIIIEKSSDKDNEVVNIVTVASKVSKRSNGTVFVTMINDAYLSFTYSWLCNTKDMDVHKSVLIITTDQASKDNLTRDWPEIEVFAMDMAGMKGDQTYSHAGYVKIMIKRTEMLNDIINAGIEFFLFEVDCLWFTNPVPEMLKIKDVDILVNPVAERTDVYAGGFLYLYPTDKGKALWKVLTDKMRNLGASIASKKDTAAISEGENDQQYLSALIAKRHGGIKVHVLPLSTYADGKWYSMKDEDRKKSHPLIVNNNWALGNKAKIDRAKQWKHWFIRNDWSCDMDLVRKTVYPSSL